MELRMNPVSDSISDRPRLASAKWIGLSLVVAVLAFLSSPHGPLGGFWRPSPDMPAPTGAQVPLFIFLNVTEAVAFGLGVSFLVFGYGLVRSAVSASRALSIATYLSIGWMLINWWPHDSLHVANGMNLSGLLRIEYGFHVTLIIAAAVLARFFLTVVSTRGLQRS
jgi:hypothetical protein